MHTISEKRKQQASRHAARKWTCACGRVCRGNGGWSSHKKVCAVHAAAVRARIEKAGV